MDALDPNAYAAFQASHDLRDVVDRVLSASGEGEEGEGGGRKPGMKKNLSIRATLMTPVKPMLVRWPLIKTKCLVIEINSMVAPSFQELLSTQMWHLETDEGVLFIERCPHFRSC